MDQGNGLQDFGTAERHGDELRIEARRIGAPRLLGPLAVAHAVDDDR